LARVGVVGAGVMGTGIAHGFLVVGRPVVLVDLDDAALQRSVVRMASMLEASAQRGRLETTPEEALSLLATSTSIDDVAGVGVAIEAVPEAASLKLDVLAALERAVDEDALVATNTSSISIGELALVLSRPARFLGLHFFNPVPASLMVEVVVGPKTGEEAVSQARELVGALGKRPIVVKDSPGFATSRLGVLLGLEAIRMLEEGVACAEDIDNAMTLGYKHPVGPLHLTDLVGLDVRLGVAEYLSSTLGPRFEPPQLLRKKVERGELGRKSGRGFFSYEEPSPRP
jgi:3-hydroxybutyryl-CoA dehydrogenase